MKRYHPLGSLCGLVASFAISSFPLIVKASEPSWWEARGVIAKDSSNNRLPASDYAVVNIGQLKNFALHAKAELDEKLPGGAGIDISNLVLGFAAPSPGRNDYSAINLGQLKAVSKLFWDRLIEEDFADEYPWSNSPTPSSDYSLANAGQMKSVFNFSVDHLDSDSDELPDWWEMKYLGHLGADGATDSDGDGISNADEYANGTNPGVAEDSDGDSIPDHIEVLEGSDPNDAGSSSNLIEVNIYTRLE